MMRCTITSPEETRQYKDLRSVTLPAFSGEMQVLSGHAESFVSLKRGNILLDRGKGQREALEIASGECYIKSNDLIVIL